MRTLKEAKIGENVRVFVRNSPADFVCKNRKCSNSRTQKRQANDENKDFQAACDQLFAVEVFLPDFDVVPQGKGDVCQVCTQEDQHSPADICQVFK